MQGAGEDSTKTTAPASRAKASQAAVAASTQARAGAKRPRAPVTAKPKAASSGKRGMVHTKFARGDSETEDEDDGGSTDLGSESETDLEEEEETDLEGVDTGDGYGDDVVVTVDGKKGTSKGKSGSQAAQVPKHHSTAASSCSSSTTLTSSGGGGAGGDTGAFELNHKGSDWGNAATPATRVTARTNTAATAATTTSAGGGALRRGESRGIDSMTTLPTASQAETLAQRSSGSAACSGNTRGRGAAPQAASGRDASKAAAATKGKPAPEADLLDMLGEADFG